MWKYIYIGTCLSFLVQSCSYGARMYFLEKSDGDNYKQETRLVRSDFDRVWIKTNYLLYIKYPIYFRDKKNGMIVTKWKTHHRFARGKIFERNALVNGVAIVEHS